MTTLQQTHPPIICYEIWEYDNEIRGSIVDSKPYWKAKQDYEVSFDLKGQNAHFVLVTNNHSITRNDAIHFAKSVYEGKVKRLNVDLTPCQPNRKK